MKRVLCISMLMLISIALFGQQRSTFSVENGGYFLERQKPGETAKRFFGIGMNVHGWPNSTMGSGVGDCQRYPSEKEFTSAKEIFTVLHLRYTPPNVLNQGCDGLPAYVTTKGHEDAILMSGEGHTRWALWARTSEYEAHHTFLGPQNQTNLASTLQPGGTDAHVVNLVLDEMIDYSEANNKLSDLIYWIADEPERGFEHWYFRSAALTPFKNRANTNGLFTYTDLGPVNGNEYLYDINGNPTPSDTQTTKYTYSDSESTEELTLKRTVSYYKNTSDLLGINSYRTTSLTPKKIGQYVNWMHSETNNKPVIPWISAECFRYSGTPKSCNDLSISQNYYRNTRNQAFSAVINKATGVMFWSEREATDGSTNALAVSDEVYGQRLSDFLNVAKELNYYRYFFENGTYGSLSSYPDYEERTINLNGTTLNVRHGTSIDTKIHYNGTADEMIFPKNLNFEYDFSTFTGLYGNWKSSGSSSSDTDISVNTDQNFVKIGHKSIYMADSSQTSRVGVEQWFDIIPGLEYQVSGWHYRTSGYQYLYMQFYGPNGWIEEHRVTSPYDPNFDPGDPSTHKWAYLSTPIEDAPLDATKIKIAIGTKTDNYQSITSKGYWDDIAVRIVGDGSTSPAKDIPESSLEEEVKPPSFELGQNYPNPFNPTTTISYRIPNDGFVTLKVYNLLGQEVATLVESQQSAGSYDIPFDASQLSSGIYLYRLTANGSVLQKKLTLIK